MKVVLPKSNPNKGEIKNIITLEPSKEDGALTSENSATFSLLSRPAEADSAKYKKQCRILQGTESVRTIVDWYLQVQKVMHGLAVTTYATMLPIVEACLEGTALIVFQSALQTLLEARMEERIAAAINEAAGNAIRALGAHHTGNHQNAMIQGAIQGMMTQLMPRRVLARIKRFLRRECRKPVGMKARQYLQHLLRANLEVIPNTPPFAENQSLAADEIIDILLFGTPKSWQKEMERQGFDPMASSVNDIIGFMERIESAEDFDTNAQKVSAKSQKTNKKKSPSQKTEELKFCSHHGPNPSHTSDQCFVLHPELKEKKKSGSKNKSWTRKAADNKKQTKSDLAAFACKEVAKGVAKATASKKRKSDDESSEGTLAGFEEMNLEDFDCDEIENLAVDDDGKSASC